MSNKKQADIINQGVHVWNEWKKNEPDYIFDSLVHAQVPVRFDLEGLDLRGRDLAGVDFEGVHLNSVNFAAANLRGANLTKAHLFRANLKGAVFACANFTKAYLNSIDATGTNFVEAIFFAADLMEAKLVEADLSNADLRQASLIAANLTSARLHGANFSNSVLSHTVFCSLDLCGIKGLSEAEHFGPSPLDVGTLYLSKGEISPIFLKGCGVPQEFITYMRSVVMNPIEYNSCFISYSHKDEDFAQRLYSRLSDKNLRVWYAPKEMKGGEKLHEQIDRAIQIHDRLLLVLSENSMSSEWVKTEIYKARQQELKQKRRILFPVALVPFAKVRDWEFFDADTGKDLAREIRDYYIPDFCHWKDHDNFEMEFAKLLRDLEVAAP